MIEFFVFIVVFGFIYALRNNIAMLQKELYLFKRSCASNMTVSSRVLSKKGRVSPKLLKEEVVEKFGEAEAPIQVKHFKPVKAKVKKISQTNTEFDVMHRVLSTIKSYFTEGNVVVRIGGIILFFGLAFLVKYAVEHSVVSIEIRLIGLALGAFAVLGLGWKLRKREGHYGIILQGLGVAILYLLVFATAKLYTLLPLSLAFAIMLIIVIVGSLLAVLQNAFALALFAISGGFLAPIITSDGSGSHIMLFSYYAMLNLGIVGIAWYRSWRLLNLTGFVFTFIVAVAWGTLRYDSSLLMTTEPFLILFFLFYVAISILFTRKQNFQARGIVDATIVFGVPLVAFSLQYSLVHEIEYALAYSAFTLGIFYFVLFKVLARFFAMRLLSSAFLALSIVFFTITIPYAFSNEITGALWALEASAIIWISLKQNHFYARIFGVLLQVIATLVYVSVSLLNQSEIAFINTTYLGYVIVSLASFVSAYHLYMYKLKLSDFDKNSSTIFLIIALGLWLYSGFQEVAQLDVLMGNAMLIYIALSSTFLALAALHLKWGELSEALEGYLFLGMLFFASLLGHYQLSHPFEDLGSVAILLFFTVHYLLLYLFDKQWSQQANLHVIGLWIMVLLGAKEFSYGIAFFTQNSTFEVAGWGFFIMLIAVTIIHVKAFLPKVFNDYNKSYKTLGAGGLMLMLVLWECYAFSLSANPAPLPYIPILNPLELIQIFGFVLMYQWLQQKENDFPMQNYSIFYGVGGVAALLFSTIMLARSIHVYVGIDYTLYALMQSTIFQMSLSVLWSIIAMLVILLAKQLAHRLIWIAGAGLMGVVVIKLFLVELSNSGSVERIVSFIVVGLLLLLIGYFAPLPPVYNEEVEE